MCYTHHKTEKNIIYNKLHECCKFVLKFPSCLRTVHCDCWLARVDDVSMSAAHANDVTVHRTQLTDLRIAQSQIRAHSLVTTQHGMQTWYSDEKAVCLSVCLSNV